MLHLFYFLLLSREFLLQLRNHSQSIYNSMLQRQGKSEYARTLFIILDTAEYLAYTSSIISLHSLDSCNLCVHYFLLSVLTL